MIGRRELLAGIAGGAIALPVRSANMSTDIVYEANIRITLNGSGAGTGTFNGPGSLTIRKLSTIVVSTLPASPRPTIVVYRSSISPPHRLAATRIGDSDTFIADGEVLATGEPLLLSITGGAAGAVVNANAFGTDVRA